MYLKQLFALFGGLQFTENTIHPDFPTSPISIVFEIHLWTNPP